MKTGLRTLLSLAVMICGLTILPVNTGVCAEFFTGMMFFPDDKQDLSQYAHMKWMKQYGFNIIEPEYCFVENGGSNWHDIEPADDTYNWFGYDHFVDDAKKAGIRVYLDPTAFAFGGAPQWCWDLYSGMKAASPTNTGNRAELVAITGVPSMAHTGYRQKARDFYTAMANRYKDNPTVAGIILGNERGLASCNATPDTYYGIDYNTSVSDGFHAFLQSKYGTIAAFNSYWGKSYASFDSINWTWQWITNTSSYCGEWLSYCLYRQKYVRDFYKELHDGVKSVAPEMPTIVASIPSQYTQQSITHGAFAGDFDFMDVVTGKHYQGQEDHNSLEMSVDFYSSLSGKPYLAMNLGNYNQMQGVPLTSDNSIQWVRQGWELIGRGAKGYLYWFWTEPNGDDNHDNMSLLTDDGQTPRTLLVKDNVPVLSENTRFVKKFDSILCNTKPYEDKQIAMLVPQLTYIEKAPSYMDLYASVASDLPAILNNDEYDAVSTHLVHNNCRISYLTDDDILANALDQHKILVLVGTEYLYADVVTAIQSWLAGSSSRYVIQTNNNGTYNEKRNSIAFANWLTTNYGSRVLSLANDKATIESAATFTSVANFVNPVITRKYDIENATRSDVSINMLRYENPSNGKNTDVIVLVNRKTIASGAVSNVTVRLTKDTNYTSATCYTPWPQNGGSDLTITESSGNQRFTISSIPHVAVVVLTEDNAVLSGDTQDSGRAYQPLPVKSQWWNSSWPYRIPVQFSSSSHNGTNMVVKCVLNTTNFPELAEMDAASMRVVEYDSDWNMGAQCSSTVTTGSGLVNVYWQMPGTTSTDTIRNFYIYARTSSAGAGSLQLPSDSTIRVQAEDAYSSDVCWRLKQRQLDGFGGRALWIERGSFHPTLVSHAYYSLTIPSTGNRDVHIRYTGGHCLGGPNPTISRMVLKLDGNVISDQSNVVLDRLWHFRTISNVNMISGGHTLTLEVTKPGPMDTDPDFVVDYIAVTSTGANPAQPIIADATWIGDLEGKTLFNDNFNVGSGSANINYQYDNASRQSGSSAPLTYTERSETASGGAADGATYVYHPWNGQDLDLFATTQFGDYNYWIYPWVSPNRNFRECGKIDIECKVDPLGIYSSNQTHRAVIVFGADKQGTYFVPQSGTYGTATSPGMALTLLHWGDNVQWAVYEDNNESAVACNNVTGKTGFYDVKISIDTPAFDGSPATVTFYVDGAQVHSRTRTTGFANNYITLGGLGLGSGGYQTSLFDDFKVTIRSDATGPTTTATPAGGTYFGSQKVVLTTNEPATIYYTTNGSTPTTSSSVYRNPLVVSSTTTLKYFAVDMSGNSESVKTQTYTIASSNTMLSDPFTTGDGNYHLDINYNRDNRQSGYLSPISWTERSQTASGGTYDWNTMLHHPWSGEELHFFCTGYYNDYPKYIWAAPNHNFNETGRMDIDFDVDPYAYGSYGAEANWIAVIFGTNVPGTYAAPQCGTYSTATSPGMAFSLCNNGAWSVNEDYDSVASGTVSSHTGFYHVKVRIETSGINGCRVKVSFYVDGRFVYSYVRESGFANNYITLAGVGLHDVVDQYQTHFFDNFTITAVPENQVILCSSSIPKERSVVVSDWVLYMKGDGWGYIMNQDRSEGMRIEGRITEDEGSLVDMSGKMRTTIDGEPYLEISSMLSFGFKNVEPIACGIDALNQTEMDGLYVEVSGVVASDAITGNSFVLADEWNGESVTVITSGALDLEPGEYVTVRGAAGYCNGLRAIISD